jgi:hypothetical protein
VAAQALRELIQDMRWDERLAEIVALEALRLRTVEEQAGTD